MKKASPRLGHSEVEYLLPQMLDRFAKEFAAADAEMKMVDSMYKSDKESVPAGAVFQARDRRIETGVLLLLVASARLEQIIYHYAVTFLDADSFKEHLERNQLLSKWLLLPRLCQGKQVEEDHPAITSLKELIKARNSVAHPKRYDLVSNVFQQKTKKEIGRFVSACRKAKSTVDALIKILETPSSCVST